MLPMTVTTRQKIIHIGSSKGSILPAKLLKELGVDVGDEVDIIVRRKVDAATNQEVLAAARSILARYKKDFKNLADR